MINRALYNEKIDSNNELTPFQKDVLKVVLEIPEGEVRSYSWVAAKAGKHGSWRAVGTALSKNPYVPFVPCHRVICSDGSIGGYSGRCSKKDMLEAEGITFRNRKGTIYIDRKDGKI